MAMAGRRVKSEVPPRMHFQPPFTSYFPQSGQVFPLEARCPSLKNRGQLPLKSPSETKPSPPSVDFTWVEDPYKYFQGALSFNPPPFPTNYLLSIADLLWSSNSPKMYNVYQVYSPSVPFPFPFLPFFPACDTRRPGRVFFSRLTSPPVKQP